MRVTDLQCAILIAAITPFIYNLLQHYCYCYCYYCHYNKGEYLYVAILVISLNIFLVAYNVIIIKIKCNVIYKMAC